MKDKIKAIESSIKEVKDIFVRNPFDYLYEFELHSELLSKIKENLSDTMDFGFKNNNFKEGVPTQFSIVRGEYHSGRQKIDIAILDDKRFTDKDFKSNGNPLYSEPVDIAIEIKYAMFDEEKDYKADIRKLKEWLNSKDEKKRINTGIAILFTHNEKWNETVKRKDVDMNDYRISEGRVNKFVIYPFNQNER